MTVRASRLRTLSLTAVAMAASLVGCAPVKAPPPSATAAVESATSSAAPATEVIGNLPAPVGDSVKDRIDLAIENVRRRDLLTTNGFWTVFHGILGLGPSVTLRDPVSGTRVNAVDHVFRGEPVRGLEFIPTDHGLDVRTGPTFVGQGHQDQFVAEMAQWGMPADRPVFVHGRSYTFLDFVRETQMRARVTADQELDWAILITAQYLGPEAAWTNEAGEPISVAAMARYLLDRPMDSAACGGTHRLFGLSWAHHLHTARRAGLRERPENEGVWKDVAANTAKYRDLAHKYQNPDGTFSTAFFRGPENEPDPQRRINTSGHILEWLALALTDDELRQPWVQDAASAVALLILGQQDNPVEGGTLYHAVHGLLIYSARVYGAKDLGPNKPVVVLPPGSRGF